MECLADKLSDEKILQLEKILSKENTKISALRISYGYMGAGGSNLSAFEPQRIEEYTMEQLCDREPISVMNAQICAVVKDVLYFRYREKKEVFTMDDRNKERIIAGESIGYDTLSAVKVELI